MVRGCWARRLVVHRPAVPRAPATAGRVDRRRRRGRRQLRRQFPEVEKINADLGVGGQRSTKLSGDVAAYLASAEEAAAARRPLRRGTRPPTHRPAARPTASRTPPSSPSSTISSSGRRDSSATDRTHPLSDDRSSVRAGRDRSSSSPGRRATAQREASSDSVMITSTIRATRSRPSSGATAATRRGDLGLAVGVALAGRLDGLHGARQRHTAGQHVAEHEVDVVDQAAVEGQRVPARATPPGCRARAPCWPSRRCAPARGSPCSR